MRRPTPMTTWKPRSRETSTRNTTWTRECARSCYSLLSPCSVSVVTLIPCTHRMAQDVRVCDSSHPRMKWAFYLTSLTSPSPSSSSSHSSSSSNSSSCPSTFPRFRSKIPCAISPRRWGQLKSPSLTQVMSPRTTSSQRRTSSSIRSPWPINGSPSSGSSRTSNMMMPQSVRCSSKHTENKSITPSENSCLLVSRRQCLKLVRCNPLWTVAKSHDRTVQTVKN